MSLAEKLIKAYKVSSPLSYSESNGADAIAWANKILRQLESGGRGDGSVVGLVDAGEPLAVEFKAAPMSGSAVKEKNCKKGYACQGSCISKSKKCRGELEGEAVKAADYLDAKVPKGKSKSKKDSSTDTPVADTKAKVKKEAANPKTEATATSQQASFTSGISDKNTNKEITGWIATNAAIRGKNDTQALRDNVLIAWEIHDKVNSNPETFRSVKDSKGNLQAAAIVFNKKDHISLEYLATAPWNLGGKDKRATRGAGAAAMKSIIAESIDKGHDGRVKLDALPGAIGFYEKVGFTKVKTKSGLNEGVISMELTPEAAKAFLAKTGGTAPPPASAQASTAKPNTKNNKEAPTTQAKQFSQGKL